MPDVGVFVVHGMGTQGPDFSTSLSEEISERLTDKGFDPTRVTWQPGFWADILADGQQGVWLRSLSAGKMDYHDIRKFVLDAMGDAVAYRRTDLDDDRKTAYERVHARMLERLEILDRQLDGPKLLIVVAHSLGSIIMSDYIWNAQQNNEWAKGRSDFVCMRSLAGFITFGSTLPLFSLALPSIDAITFPAPELPEFARRVAEWNNYYDRDDVLGWPLKKLSPSYTRAVTADHEIDVGNWITGWNPAAHTAYWTDRDFLNPVADQIERLLNAIDDEEGSAGAINSARARSQRPSPF